MRRKRRRLKPRLNGEADVDEEDEFDIDTLDMWMAEAEVWRARLFHEARKLAKKRRIETYVI